MKSLKSNPYTFKVTKNKLYFTVESKETFLIDFTVIHPLKNVIKI